MVPILPPPLQKLADTPVLRSEIPPGFHHATVVRLAPDRRIHTLGAVRVDFTNARASESASYALFVTRTRASAFARRERAVKTGSLFRVQVAVVGRIVVGVTAKTRAQANALLILAIRHLRRSESS